MLYSSSGGFSPSRVPSAAKRWEMARRPERRPSRTAMNPTSTQSAAAPATKMITCVWVRSISPGVLSGTPPI